MDEKIAKQLIESAVSSLESSIPEEEIDCTHVTLFDEIAFMSGKGQGVKSRPLASAISISNLAGQIVKSTIIVGGEHCFQKASANEKITFEPVKIPLAFGLNAELKSMIQEVN